MKYLVLVSVIFISACLGASAQDPNLFGGISDPMVSAKEKLIRAKGHYEIIKQQESALKDLKKATKLGLKASQLREKAEKLQAKSDALTNKAKQTAISRGLFISTPFNNDPAQQTPDAASGSANLPSAVPIPGQPVNIFVPPPQQTAYGQNNGLPAAPVPGF